MQLIVGNGDQPLTTKFFRQFIQLNGQLIFAPAQEQLRLQQRVERINVTQ